MAAKGKTVNQGLSGNQNNNNTLSNDIKNLTKDLASLFSKRFGSTKAGNAEAKKYKELLESGAISAEKLRAALELKSQRQLAKEQRDAAIKQRQQEAAIALATIDKEKNLQAWKEARDKVREAERAKRAAEFNDNLKKAGAEAAGKLMNAALNFGNSLDIEGYASIIAKYSASVEARLQGSEVREKDRNNLYENLVRNVKSTLAASPYLKQEKMLDNLNELIQLGVNYNIELRAFLLSMTDKVVTTFNAFDSNLLNLIKLQQADSTAARMGMEASLTKSFNSMFKDTSYLSNTYDSVSQALFDTISQMGKEEGVEFEYVVQKWLGSLGSVGVSNDALTKIATAVNYLGTGNVEALAGDSAMQNLLTKAASLLGLSYSNMLTEGLTADSTNRLMRGIVDYVREISATDNNVVRQQFGQLFGMSMSDMVAALNLNTKELDTVQSAMLSYSNAVKETQSQLNQVSDRMHISEMVNNLFDNVMMTTAGNIANNSATYMLWKSLNMVEKLTGGIAIPTVSVMGNSVDLNSTVVGLMKTGIAGLSLLGTLTSAVGSLSNGGSLSLSNWGGEEYLSRGTGFGGVQAGYSVTRSSSTAVVSSSGADMAEHSISAAQEEGNEKIAAAQSEETNTEKMLKAIMIAVTGSDNPGEATPGVNVQLGDTVAGALSVYVVNQLPFNLNTSTAATY